MVQALLTALSRPPCPPAPAASTPAPAASPLVFWLAINMGVTGARLLELQWWLLGEWARLGNCAQGRGQRAGLGTRGRGKGMGLLVGPRGEASMSAAGGGQGAHAWLRSRIVTGPQGQRSIGQ